MYKNSKNKSNILASMHSPINKELVEQLKAYIDIPEVEDNQVSEKVVLKDISIKSEDSDSFNESTTDDGDLDQTKTMIEPENTDEPVEDVEDSKEVESAPVAQSSDVKGTPVVAQTVLYPTNKCVAYTSIDDVVHELKGALNLQDSTAGVLRVQVKKDELWIYYDDSINLNSIMNPVLEYLNSASYNYLEFNRLARSDNAIVFEISFIDTANVMKPEGALNEI